MKGSSIASLITGTAMTGIATLGLPHFNPKVPFNNHRDIANKKNVISTIRQGNSTRYHNSYPIIIRSNRGGGSSYGK